MLCFYFTSKLVLLIPFIAGTSFQYLGRYIYSFKRIDFEYRQLSLDPLSYSSCHVSKEWDAPAVA